jgi:hypothetical protein
VQNPFRSQSYSHQVVEEEDEEQASQASLSQRSVFDEDSVSIQDSVTHVDSSVIEEGKQEDQESLNESLSRSQESENNLRTPSPGVKRRRTENYQGLEAINALAEASLVDMGSSPSRFAIYIARKEKELEQLRSQVGFQTKRLVQGKQEIEKLRKSLERSQQQFTEEKRRYRENIVFKVLIFSP